MARRNTKADRILNESAMRLEAARLRHQLAQSQLNTAKAVLEAVEAAHGALERELTAQPRKRSEKPTGSQAAAKEPAAEKTPVPPGLCAFKYESGDICLCAADNLIHDAAGGYSGQHEFVAAKPARKPRTKKETPTVIPVSDQGIDGNGLAAEMSED